MKLFKSTFVVLLTVVTLLSSRPSQAAVGAAFSASAVVITGLVVAGGGAFISVDTLGDRGNLRGLVTIFIGLPLMLLGLIVLDEEQVVSFAPLTNAESRELGLSLQEVKIYNSEIDQANALLALWKP